MSSQPPLFAPQSRKARPSSADVRPASARASAAGDAPVERRALSDPARHQGATPSSAPNPAPRATPTPTPRPAPQPIVLSPGERPHVMGIAAPDAQARQWRVDVSAADGLPSEPSGRLVPTTADQPAKEQPPSFAPQRLREAHARTSGGANASVRTSASARGGGYSAGSASQAQRAASPRGTSHPLRAAYASSSRASASPTGTLAAAPAFTSAQRSHAPRRRAGRFVKRFFGLIVLALVIVLSWGAFLIWDANTNLGRLAALSTKADTPGVTYLLAGSDSREDGAIQDGFTDSARTDSIMLINIAPNGQAAAVTIPRDTLVEIPGYGWDKINSSYPLGGPELLVETVEHLTGLTVDHYVQVGMGGVASIVDAVGGINVCYDGDVTGDPSGLEWTAGCHDVDGSTALAFSRMRYADPTGDIGRTLRQRQVISRVVEKAATPSTLLNPARTLRLERAGSAAFTVDDDASIIDVARLTLTFRKASETGLMGTPPIESVDYITDMGASTVLLVDTTAPQFFEKLAAGQLSSEDFNVIFG